MYLCNRKRKKKNPKNPTTMKTTTPTTWHKPQPTHHRAAHLKSEAERAAQEARRESRIIRAIAEKGNMSLCQPAALRRELLRFRLQLHPTELKVGTYLMVAISQETGEIRKYTTRFLENQKFIGNADFILNGKEKTLYITLVRTGNENTSWSEIDRREAGN